MQNEINALVETLKKSRADATENKTAMAEMLKRVTESMEYVNLKNTLDYAEQVGRETDAKIRELAVSFYDETEDKHPHPSVSIAVTPTAKISDPAAARAWCETHLQAALSVVMDESKVKKYALEFEAVPGVTVENVPGVKIASKL